MSDGLDIDYRVRKQALLETFRNVARGGGRCPSNEQLRYVFGHVAPSQLAQELAAEGCIRIEVYARNWRVIEILTTGLRTKAPPNAGEPYLVIDANGRREL